MTPADQMEAWEPATAQLRSFSAFDFSSLFWDRNENLY